MYRNVELVNMYDGRRRCAGLAGEVSVLPILLCFVDIRQDLLQAGVAVSHLDKRDSYPIDLNNWSPGTVSQKILVSEIAGFRF